jgi:hypothetical protein
MVSSVATLETGALTFELIDEDGEELPGSWSYEWSGRDPLELALYAITELSGKPWKWTSRTGARARISPGRCKAFSIRVGKVLRKETRVVASAVIARIITQETLRPGKPAPDVRVIAEVLSGKRDPDWDAGPLETTPAMIRALRNALRAASECDGGLQIVWGDPDR